MEPAMIKLLDLMSQSRKTRIKTVLALPSLGSLSNGIKITWDTLFQLFLVAVAVLSKALLLREKINKNWLIPQSPGQPLKNCLITMMLILSLSTIILTKLHYLPTSRGCYFNFLFLFKVIYSRVGCSVLWARSRPQSTPGSRNTLPSSPASSGAVVRGFPGNLSVTGSCARTRTTRFQSRLNCTKVFWTQSGETEAKWVGVAGLAVPGLQQCQILTTITVAKPSN